MKIISFISLLLIGISCPLSASTIQFGSNGEVIGIQGIFLSDPQVYGYYDVTFQDGSCIVLFSGCDQGSDIAPGANIIARGAAISLLNILSIYSSTPNSIRGCESLTECIIETPDNILPAGAGVATDGISFVRDLWASNSFGAYRDQDLTLEDNRTYAVWTVSAVPVPAAVWLFSSGLLGLVGMARRKKA